ncbi:MAG: ArsR family transcriptional regulator [Bacteroidetes bacterium CG12_big_fil_rev_8_21_14_0_65_60_17]|nr:MAG: ArsR family transcriptional regulator [Bacteroidetes bacterium CG12_big_fil_rev_8_21_14_0_65_60_17]
MKRIDRTDERILGLLQKNARTTNRDVAELTGVAPSTSLERTRRLEEIGVIRGYHADVDPSHMGVNILALIAVRLTKHKPGGVRDFLTHADCLQEVREVYHVAGADDFLLHVAVRDSEHLRRFVLESVTARPEVDHVETNLIFSHRRRYALTSLWDNNM